MSILAECAKHRFSWLWMGSILSAISNRILSPSFKSELDLFLWKLGRLPGVCVSTDTRMGVVLVVYKPTWNLSQLRALQELFPYPGIWRYSWPPLLYLGVFQDSTFYPSFWTLLLQSWYFGVLLLPSMWISTFCLVVLRLDSPFNFEGFGYMVYFTFKSPSAPCSEAHKSSTGPLH